MESYSLLMPFRPFILHFWGSLIFHSFHRFSILIRSQKSEHLPQPIQGKVTEINHAFFSAPQWRTISVPVTYLTYLLLENARLQSKLTCLEKRYLQYIFPHILIAFDTVCMHHYHTNNLQNNMMVVEKKMHTFHPLFWITYQNILTSRIMTLLSSTA